MPLTSSHSEIVIDKPLVPLWSRRFLYALTVQRCISPSEASVRLSDGSERQNPPTTHSPASVPAQRHLSKEETQTVKEVAVWVFPDYIFYLRSEHRLMNKTRCSQTNIKMSALSSKLERVCVLLSSSRYAPPLLAYSKPF